MIKETTMYQAVCDNCGRHEEQIFEKCDDIRRVILWRGWHFINGNLCCPDCAENARETDSYKPKENRQ